MKPSLREEDPKATDYLAEHAKACEWAKANRDLIALRFLAILGPGEEAWDPGSRETATVSEAALVQARTKLAERKVVDIWHNNVERIPWPPAPPSDTNLRDATNSLPIPHHMQPQEHVYIHRKGAAPTYDPGTNQPLSLLPLPGSRATPTLILRPTFSATTGYGAHNALSLAHGAGRALSRAKALSSLTSKYKDPSVLLKPIAAPQQRDSRSMGEDVHRGTWVICDEKDLVYEEVPEAYKDVYAVADDLVKEGVAEVLGWCRARVSYEVRNKGR
ncbi:hypothetical protein LTS18_007438 [Coniosporium uncinatum]|uniref:Uncharacterized protein n=1 Tax=Coniosporium uncinatum TaxID=93489 RepID=A0ACC3D328_9PEZI|nr:hypothetical protein LTS18_007438 [Coniosporium uncinatum]